MDFQPPDPADLANVHALNGAFVTCIRMKNLPAVALAALPAGLGDALADSDAASAERLCNSPFLLFSLAEHDMPRWARLFDGPRGREPDLIDAMQMHDGPPMRVVLAALGFLWQLARRRPYAARVVSGATLAWCEQLADCTLLDVFQFAATDAGLLGFRMPGDKAFWRRILVAGTSPEPSIRRAARLSALQTILTASQAGNYWRMQAAACSMPLPAQQVAETSVVSKPKARGYNTPLDESAADNEAHQNLRKR